ncbi:DUF6036 family nucleotidyltransferase [Rhodohalobacter sp.]|uniref:DUF6036 family nucleotidyltransferase n=1 Tax=Rhodohalobacter sp. TaxID=1974210 RepID=UPI002ACDE230|nr:DUF6036 family nucleotidyltransferase [Rhodohalobacter sp.]MDZ7757900.1 DUF6036 family nucleotidyltransferase [Rhodohalobacter sp.]
MNREQLEHAIRAACTVSEDQELIIFGSQAILGQFPDAPSELRKSIEVDVSPKNKPEAVDKIDGALGENSLFHKTHGFYVHGVPIETAKLPKGWEKRTNKVQDYMDGNYLGYCIEAHDLAASKLIAFREKDTEFVRRLILEEMIDIDTLLKRLKVTDAEKEIKERAIRWAERIAENL